MAQNPVFWGRAGSGILLIADDDTALLTLRSMHVLQPNTWGVPGGAVSGTEGLHRSGGKRQFKFTYRRAWESAIRETEEELGYFPAQYRVIGYTEFEDGTFVFITFIVLVGQKEKRYITENTQLDPHEASRIAWIPMRKLLRYRDDQFLESSLHFGVKFIMDELAKG
jgi:8-oxo-dGTP pyrophosphatase MutT (NUDIX family)